VRRAAKPKTLYIQAKNALHYAELRIMPTSVAKPAWEAAIAVKDAAYLMV